MASNKRTSFLPNVFSLSSLPFFLLLCPHIITLDYYNQYTASIFAIDVGIPSNPNHHNCNITIISRITHITNTIVLAASAGTTRSIHE
jgi:hypothetical protein